MKTHRNSFGEGVINKNNKTIKEKLLMRRDEPCDPTVTHRKFASLQVAFKFF